MHCSVIRFFEPNFVCGFAVAIGVGFLVVPFLVAVVVAVVDLWHDSFAKVLGGSVPAKWHLKLPQHCELDIFYAARRFSWQSRPIPFRSSNLAGAQIAPISLTCFT